MDGQRLSLLEEAILGRRGVEELVAPARLVLSLSTRASVEMRAYVIVWERRRVLSDPGTILFHGMIVGGRGRGCWLSVLVVAATMLCTPRRSSLKPVRRVTPCVPRESKVRMHRRLFLPSSILDSCFNRVISYFLLFGIVIYLMRSVIIIKRIWMKWILHYISC